MPWGALKLFYALLALSLGQALQAFSFPQGTEIRLLSPDLKTLYAAWRVQEGRLLPLSPPIPPKVGQEVRLLISEPGKKPVTLEAMADKEDLLIIVSGKTQISFLKLLKDLRLTPPERLW
ncbi:MAG: hypothetical protein ACUVQD_05030 [Thermaceae bacterium]